MKTKIIICTLLLSITVYSQDAAFTQFNAVSLYFNPGYAGSEGSPRLAASYGNSWESQHQSAYISYDQVVSRLHGGVGLIAYNHHYKPKYDLAYSNVFYCGLAYAAKFNLSSKLAISPAIKIGYRRDDNYFPEFLYGSIAPMNYISKYKQNIDISLGFVINTKKLHLGLAVDHLNEPKIYSYFGGMRLGRKYVGQFGYTFQKNNTSNFSITPSLMYQIYQMRNIEQSYTYYTAPLRANISFRYKFAVIGTGINGGNTYNFLLGYYSKKMMIGYSYERYLSTNFYNYDRHELSVRYIIAPKKDEKDVNQTKDSKRYKLFRKNKKILQT